MLRLLEQLFTLRPISAKHGHLGLPARHVPQLIQILGAQCRLLALDCHGQRRAQVAGERAGTGQNPAHFGDQNRIVLSLGQGECPLEQRSTFGGLATPRTNTAHGEADRRFQPAIMETLDHGQCALTVR